MGREPGQFLPGDCLPEANGLVAAAGRHAPTGRVERDAENRAAVAGERHDLFAGRDLPEFNGARLGAAAGRTAGIQ